MKANPLLGLLAFALSTVMVMALDKPDNQNTKCKLWAMAQKGMTCDRFAAHCGVDVKRLVQINPGLKSEAKCRNNLWAGYRFCCSEKPALPARPPPPPKSTQKSTEKHTLTASSKTPAATQKSTSRRPLEEHTLTASSKYQGPTLPPIQCAIMDDCFDAYSEASCSADTRKHVKKWCQELVETGTQPAGKPGFMEDMCVPMQVFPYCRCFLDGQMDKDC